jgi:hypothetical protein
MIARLKKGPLLAALALCLAALPPILSPSAEPAKKGKLTHIGLVWLKKAGSDADRHRIIEALRQFAREIPEVQLLTLGKPHPAASKLVDSTFDVCFTMDFEDQAALDRYARHPVHQKAAEDVFLPLSRKILFYDFTNE